MNVVELGDKTKQVDAILYNLMGEYLEGGMDAEAKSQFERWWDLLVRGQEDHFITVGSKMHRCIQ